MAALVINDYTITEFLDFEAYFRNTGMLDFKLEELQGFTLEASQDKQELTGKNGRVIGYKKRNKKISGNGTYGMISAGLMKAQTGGEITSGDYEIKKSELAVVNGTTITTEATAIGTAGKEIGYIKQLSANGSVIATYEQATVADDTHFSYDPGTKTITLPKKSEDGVIPDGSKIIFAYTRKVSGTKVTNPSNKYSETREVWIHCFGTDACDNEFYIAIYVPRADFNGNFSLDLGGDQVVHDFSFDGIPDLCAANSGLDSNLFEVIVYTDEVTD